MSGPLFRAETEAARSRAWLGRIVLIRPVSFAVLTASALAATIALAAFFTFGEYTRKARVTGMLSPATGVVKVVAPLSGTVERVHTSEGMTVARDDVMVSLADARAISANEGLANAVVAGVKERQRALVRQRAFVIHAAEIEQLALVQRAAGLQRELDQLDREIDAQERRSTLAREGAGRTRQLERLGFVSRAAADRDAENAIESQLRIETARRTRLALSREINAMSLEAQASMSKASAQLSGLDMQAAALEQERIERDSQYRAEVSTPSAGTVAAVLVEAGQTVAAGMPLATVIPADTMLEAHLFSPSRSIGFVRPGQEVLLRFQSFPHQKFGSHRARIVAVSRTPLLPAEVGYTPADGSREPVYRIKAALLSQSIAAYGREEPLQAGMQVDADLMLDRRRLIEWIFEPLLSLAGRA